MCAVPGHVCSANGLFDLYEAVNHRLSPCGEDRRQAGATVCGDDGVPVGPTPDFALHPVMNVRLPVMRVQRRERV